MNFVFYTLSLSTVSIHTVSTIIHIDHTRTKMSGPVRTPPARGAHLFILPLRFELANSGSSKMPPMAFRGLVTKVGFMDKTATVTVTRWVAHKLTRKVCITLHFSVLFFWLLFLKRIERSKKYLTHDPENSTPKLSDFILGTVTYIRTRIAKGRHCGYSQLPAGLCEKTFQAGDNRQ